MITDYKPTKLWSIQEIQILLNLYPQNIHQSVILSKLNNKNWVQVQGKAKNLNLKRPIFKPYNVNSNYFKNIDNIEQAYLLGLIAADGCLTSKNSGIVLNIHNKDIELLNIFKNNVVPDYHIKTNKRNISKIEIYDDVLYNDIMKLGIKPRKTFDLQWPYHIPTNLEMPFILGYFDGDGCLRWNQDNREQYVNYHGCWRWILLGQLNFLNQVRSRIYYHTKIQINKPLKMYKANVYTINKSGKYAVLLDEYFSQYNIGLKRKRIKYFSEHND